MSQSPTVLKPLLVKEAVKISLLRVENAIAVFPPEAVNQTMCKVVADSHEDAVRAAVAKHHIVCLALVQSKRIKIPPPHFDCHAFSFRIEHHHGVAPVASIDGKQTVTV